MKKLILGAVLILGFTGFSTAQKVADSAAKKHAANKVKATKPVTAVATAPKPATAAKTAVKPVPATPAKPATTQPVVLKKDGTRDKRYKNAPDTAKGPLKKDGTPDKRFKSKKKS